MKSLACVLAVFVLLSVAGLLPFESHDAAELQPVRALVAEFTDEGVRLSGDGGQSGSGKTWEEAVSDLKNSASGVAFLQTAEKIILTGNVTQALQTVAESDVLRPAAELFTANTPGDAEQLYAYLKTRSSQVTVAAIRAALQAGASLCLPCLDISEGKVRLQDG